MNLSVCLFDCLFLFCVFGTNRHALSELYKKQIIFCKKFLGTLTSRVESSSRTSSESGIKIISIRRARKKKISQVLKGPMAEAAEREGEEAGPRPAVDLSISFNTLKISLKIADRQLAGRILLGIGIGCGVSLGVLFYRNPELVKSVITEVLSRPAIEVGNIATGSILVDLYCGTKESFLNFIKDFKARKVEQRLEEKFKKAGFEMNLEVTITNEIEVYKRLAQIDKEFYEKLVHIGQEVSVKNVQER